MKTLILAIATVIVSTTASLAGGSLSFNLTNLDSVNNADRNAAVINFKQSNKVSDTTTLKFGHKIRINETVGQAATTSLDTDFGFAFKNSAFSLLTNFNVQDIKTDVSIKHNDSGVNLNVSFSDTATTLNVRKTFKW